MMNIPLPRPAFRPLPPIAATLALACVLWWFALPMVWLAGTAALALAVRHLLIRLDAPQPSRAAALVFILPSAVINAGLMGQCDALWAAPCTMALAAAIDRKHLAMLVWCGLALGINVQALLIAPFFLALLINRRVPLHLWLVAPLVAAATMLPAWAAGWSARDLAAIYVRQAATYPALSMNAPNLWQIVEALPFIGRLPLSGLALAAALGATAAYVALFSTRRTTVYSSTEPSTSPAASATAKPAQ